ncbi:MAG: long-chain-fatty-acid--CoA ligase [Anaerolineae bacterium]|nr:long-chain-fatty-acid--CoA ligase [Anaerolineae bacterium]
MEVPLTPMEFARRARRLYANREAVVDGDLRMTYGQFFERCDRWSSALQEFGIQPGDRVAYIAPNTHAQLESFYAVPQIGAVLVPTNYRLTADDFAYIINHCGARIVCAHSDYLDAVDRIRDQLPHVEQYVALEGQQEGWVDYETTLAQASPDFERPAIHESDLITINYTSGTTARPKGVQLTHRNIWLNATTFGWQLGITDRDVYLHTLPQFHCNGWGVLYAVTGMGAKHVIIRKIDGTEILRRVQQHGVTVMCAAPAVANAILDAASHWEGEIPGRNRVRIVCAGAPPPTRTIERIETELGWEFIQIYGLTETAPLLTMNRRRSEWDEFDPGDRARRLGRAGAPALGVQLGISDQGEVLARSNVVLRSYWENPQATDEALEGGWFHTGDGGVLDDEGYLTISDRKKDVIITGGENVSSIEIEDALFSHPDVDEVAVIGIPSDKWGETPKALVVVTPGSVATEADLIAWCRERLAHYKCPSSIEFRDELARTATGKLQKFKLRAPYWEGRDRLVN